MKIASWAKQAFHECNICSTPLRVCRVKCELLFEWSAELRRRTQPTAAFPLFIYFLKPRMTSQFYNLARLSKDWVFQVLLASKSLYFTAVNIQPRTYLVSSIYQNSAKVFSECSHTSRVYRSENIGQPRAGRSARIDLLGVGGKTGIQHEWLLFSFEWLPSF